MNTKILPNKNLLYVLAGVALIAVLFAVYHFYTKYQNDQTVVAVANETVKAPDFNFSFAYPSGENALLLIEPPVADQAFQKAYILMQADDYTEFQNSTEGREAPMAISVFVYELGDAAPEETATTTVDRPNRITRLQNWAMDNSAITSFNAALGTPDIVEIDSVKALHYRADGLYQQDIYLASYSGNVYMFAAQFNEESDLTFTAFQELIASVSFD